MKPSLVVFLHSHRYDRLYQAAALTLSASAMGWPCHLFLFHGALASYMTGGWDERNITESLGEGAEHLPAWVERLESGFETGNFPSLYDMLEKAAAESGGLKILACSTSCKLLGLDAAEVRERVDEIVGLPTMMGIAGEARHVLYV